MTPHLRPHRRSPAPHPQSLDPDGTETVSGDAGDGSSLAFDPLHTGTNPAITTPALTVTESPSNTPSPTPTTPPPTPPPSKAKLSTGAIVGIAVAVFALLAVGLVIIMSINHEKKMSRRRQRARSGSKSAAEGKGTAIQMTEKQPRSPSAADPAAAPAVGTAGGIPPPPVFRGNTTSSVGDDDSFLSLRSTNSLQRLGPIAPVSTNPFVPYSASQQLRNLQSHQRTTTPTHPLGSTSTSTSTSGPTIPNPFSSPAPSRSPSNATSHAPTSSAASIDPNTLASFPAVHYLSANPSPNNAHFSISDYTDADPTSPRADPEYEAAYEYQGEDGEDDDDDDLPPQPIHRNQNLKPQARDARARENRALQDLLSALDSGPSSAPTSWLGVERGSSRLSRGEGLVTPVEPADSEFDPRRSTTAKAYVPPSPTQTHDHPLKLKGKGKEKGRENPFEG